jgi:hypothetical protein
MKKDLHKHNQFLRFTGLTVVILFGILTTFGSGGGGDNEGGGTSIGLLGTYNFNLNRGYDSSGVLSDGIFVTISDTPSNITLRVDPHPVVGSFNCDTNTGECNLARLNTGTFLDVYDENATIFVGDLHIQILDQVIYGVSGLPVIGRIQIESVAAPDGLGEGFIQIEMTSCATGAGVNLYDNGALVDCYTWDQFEQLLDTSLDPIEQLASFGYQVIHFLFEQVDFVTQIFGYIDDYDVDLEQAGTISEMCDAFSAAGLTAPSGVVDQGLRSLSWIDSNSNGTLGPGDSFTGSLDECWVNDPTDTVDQLLNGLGDFIGYIENIDQNREVITAIGFTSVSPPTPGGVFFTGFTIGETEETSPGNAEITNVVGLEGGFSILFTEP